MSEDEPFDPRFSLPAIDDPAPVEVGVILLGLDAERLLAGLGVASMADDPGAVALLVDRLRHGAPAGLTLSGALRSGIRRWRSARPELDRDGRAGPTSAALRQAWAAAVATVSGSGLDPGPASRAYLAACWLRKSDVDRYVEEHHAVPEVPA